MTGPGQPPPPAWRSTPEWPEAHPALRTSFCQLAGVRYPIVQTGMGWVAGPRLVAATAAAGGLGILASATMTLDQLDAALDDVRHRTDRPFGVNLRADAADAVERIRLMAGAGVRVASFAQPPTADLVRRCHDRDLAVVPTIGARRHAEKMAELGVDAVIAQGAEGGGHTGSVPTSLLLPDVVDAVGDRMPVLGAGGFYDGRGLVAALAFGASGVAMGTRFLLTSTSPVPDQVKARYLATPVTGTVVTSRVDGSPQRVVRTDLIARLERSRRYRSLPRALASALAFRRETGSSVAALVAEGRAMRAGRTLTWAQVLMAANAPMMTKAALVEGRTNAGVLPTGQAVGLIDTLPSVAEVMAAIVTEANLVLTGFSRSGPTPPDPETSSEPPLP